MLTVALMEQAPGDVTVGREMTIKLDDRNRPEPDLRLTTAGYDGDCTRFAPHEVRLVIEVVSPTSAHRDRTVKLRKYAEAGIPHYWCVEDESGAPVVHVYELDESTGVYAPAGIFRGTLERPAPFEVSLDLDKLTPPRENQESISTKSARETRRDQTRQGPTPSDPHDDQ